MKDLNNYKKKLAMSDNFDIPTELVFGDLAATPLHREDVDEDLEAVNSSLEIIRRTRGGGWPSEKLSRDFNLLDLAWHEREFRDRSSFAYAIRLKGEYVGCFYIYAIGERKELSEETDQYDADFSWWVTQEAFDNGVYEKVFCALKEWHGSFPFKNILFSNTLIPEEK